MKTLTPPLDLSPEAALLAARPDPVAAAVAGFLAGCPIIGPRPQVSVLPCGGYAVQVTGAEDRPVIEVLQRVDVDEHHKDGWAGTPARWYASTLVEPSRAGRGVLSIDFGNGWALPAADSAAVYALADRLAAPPAPRRFSTCPPHAAVLHRIASLITTEELPPAHLSVNGRDVVVDCSSDELVENAVRRWAAALELVVVEVPVDGPAGVAATRWDASGWDGTGCWWHVLGDLPVAVTA